MTSSCVGQRLHGNAPPQQRPTRFILKVEVPLPRQHPHASPLSADLPRRGALPARRRCSAAPQPVPRQLLRGMFPEAGETGGRRRGGERQLSRQLLMQQEPPAPPELPSDTRGGVDLRLKLAVVKETGTKDSTGPLLYAHALWWTHSSGVCSTTSHHFWYF